MKFGFDLDRQPTACFQSENSQVKEEVNDNDPIILLYAWSKRQEQHVGHVLTFSEPHHRRWEKCQGDGGGD